MGNHHHEEENNSKSDGNTCVKAKSMLSPSIDADDGNKNIFFTHPHLEKLARNIPGAEEINEKDIK